MKRIFYAGGSLVTGDRIADAVLGYAAALANMGRAHTVELPERDDRGDVSSTTLVLGPASQLYAVSEHQDAPELTDEALVADLERRTRALHPPKAQPLDPDEVHGYTSIDVLDT